MNKDNFKVWARTIQDQVEKGLEQFLPQSRPELSRLHEAMRYSLLGGGKRVRPLLVYAAASLGNPSEQHVLKAACAVEMIHAYSLVHDDMPAMDNDSLRRGKPTCHIQYDEATALLVGDALQTKAFELLSQEDLSVTSDIQVKLISYLAKASGSQGMCGGQAIDLAHVAKPMNLTELEYMHCLKTGALIRASVLMGGVLANLSSENLEKLDQFGKTIGLAFQVVDDILDTVSDSATLGKTAGKDEQQAKPTYVSLMGLNEAKAFAAELHTRSISLLNQLPNNPQHLRNIAEFIVQRPY